MGAERVESRGAQRQHRPGQWRTAQAGDAAGGGGQGFAGDAALAAVARFIVSRTQRQTILCSSTRKQTMTQHVYHKE